jgi:exonuclease III
VYKVVGNSYIKSSRTSFVSIKASIVPFLPKNVILKFNNFLFWKTVSAARSVIFFHQNAKTKHQIPILLMHLFSQISKSMALRGKQIIKTRNFVKFISKILSLKNTQLNLVQSHLSLDSLLFKVCYRDTINRKRLIILSGDVEMNPGPVRDTREESLVIKTYNIRGLKDFHKLKRTLNKCAGNIKANSNTVYNLQESHLEIADKNKINLMWRGNFSLSPGRNKSRGCLTLYDSSWELLDELVDDNGRYTILTLKKAIGTFTIVNLYAPNENSLDFFENIFTQSIRIKDNYDSDLIIVGDFNLVINKETDSIERIQTTNEKIVSDFVRDSMAALSLKDCYRHVNQDRGYTWSRGKCLSRLDMIFASSTMVSHIDSSNIDWAFEKSDHALLECVFKYSSTRTKGPGLPKLDPEIIKNQYCVLNIRNNLKEVLEKIPTDWNPHKVWEYIKVMLRSFAWEEASKQKITKNKEEEALVAQINRLQSNKSALASQGRLGECVAIDQCIKELEENLKEIWVNKSKKLAFIAGVKWFDEGEKSNKYFLNIIKKRKAETYIERLQNGNVMANGQIEVQNLVKEFYEDLYDARLDLDDNYDSFFPPDLPKLSDVDRDTLDGRFTTEELKATLKTCRESAPGPDGITYKYYEVFWGEIGGYLLDAWEYSKLISHLPQSQRQSTITLLPKEGKDITQIGNWRPITLTNCDLKIITKTIANRVSKVLDKIISPTQTAYIPGRVVHDNLRMFEFYRKYCQENNIDAVLMSMDAKKAFDSVDHKYMFNTLKAYGFSDDFIDTVKILYKDIEADIMVNGYRTTIIKIRRCVKQGDAFSCALFIICIDPLLRNIERNNQIKAITIRTPLTNSKICPKTGAFADDVGTITKGDKVSIDEVFREYKRFSKMSGIEINETKTEVMKMGQTGNFVAENIYINNGVNTFVVSTVEIVKICGITFSNNTLKSYECNVLEKINKLKKKLSAWQYRGLSLGGKILVTKTFGVSQLIYSMQACKYEESDIKKAEAFIFKFLWNKNLSGNKAPERIKRSILKSDYEAGGLRVTDLQNLNNALKLRQFFRANVCNHPIKDIQRCLIEMVEYDHLVNQEYSRISNMENIVNSAQMTLNTLTDRFRDSVLADVTNNVEIADFKVNLIASTDVLEYLKRKKFLINIGFFMPLFRSGIENFKQLVTESIYPRSENNSRLARLTLTAFPDCWKNVVANNIECNADINIRHHIMVLTNKPTKMLDCTVAKIKNGLLENNGIVSFPYEIKLGISPHEGINPFIVARKVNHSTNLKIFKYRLLHMDIFTKQRMFKFKMSQSEMCDYCGEVEDVKHVLWQCARANRIWIFFDTILRGVGIQLNIHFENLFIGFNPTNQVIESIITRLTQIILRIDRVNGVENNVVKHEIMLLAKKYLHINPHENENNIIWRNIIAFIEGMG